MTHGTGRVVLVIPRLHRGGAGKQLVYLAVGLQHRGWRVRAVTLLPRGEYARELEDAGVRVSTLGLTRPVPDPRILVRYIRLLREWEPDAVVAFLFHATLLARLSAPFGGDVALISSVRNERFGGRGRELVQSLLRSVDDVTTVNSARVARRLAGRGVLDPERLEVVENAVNLSEYGAPPNPELRRSLGVEPEDVLWLAVGDLHPQKDYGTLLRAWRRVATRVSGVQLRVAGEGPRRSRLEDRIRELGIADSCDLLGHRDDVPALLAAADAFVMSSRWEGFPNAMMEAMAAGLPVVGTRAGGIPELLGRGELGMIVAPGDPDELARAMVRISSGSPADRRRLGRRARRRVEERHGVERVVSQWEQLLRETIDG